LGFANPLIREHLEAFYDEIGREDGCCVDPGFLTRRMKGFTRAFIQTLDNKAAVQGASGWLEKTPMHLHFISRIQRYIPNAQFIHLIRDGRDVVASMYEVTQKYPEVWGGRSIEQCLKRWTGDIERTRRYVGKPGHHVVRYRDIVTDPEETLRRLCRVLEISFSSNMIRKYSAQAEKVSGASESWKEGTTQEIRYRGHEKFDLLFDSEETSRISSVVADYTLDTLKAFWPYLKKCTSNSELRNSRLFCISRSASWQKTMVS
jgi:hypothetical protein